MGSNTVKSAFHLQAVLDTQVKDACHMDAYNTQVAMPVWLDVGLSVNDPVSGKLFWQVRQQIVRQL